MSLVTLILGIIIARLFWRQLVTLVAWLALVCLLALMWRAAPSLGLSSAWLGTAYGAGVAGFIVGALLALKPIINWLVSADLQRDIERAQQNADRRRV